MNIGIPKGFAAASVMAAVLLLGPAAMPLPAVNHQATQGPSVAADQPAAQELPSLNAAPPAATHPALNPAPKPRIQVAKPLPWITAGATVPAAPGDIDTPYSGRLAAPKADGLMVHATPDGTPFGLLPARVLDSDGSDRTWMPVIGSATGNGCRCSCRHAAICPVRGPR
jgi:hypothetical protein